MGNQFEKPHIHEQWSALGIKKPNDLPEFTTELGIRICAGNQRWTKSLDKLVSKYPQLWIDKGMIRYSPDQMMKIPLVEGWQNLASLSPDRIL